MSWLAAARQELPLTGEGRVDQDEAGDDRRLRGEDVEPAGRVGGNPEDVVEGVDQQQSRDEGRHADAERAEETHAVIDDGVGLQRGEDAERQRQRQGDEQCGEGQFEGGGQPVDQVGHDRLAGVHGATEIAGRDILQIEQQLLRQRFVEPHLLADHLDLGLPGIGTGGEKHRRIARQHPHQQEGEDDHAEERRDGREGPSSGAPGNGDCEAHVTIRSASRRGSRPAGGSRRCSRRCSSASRRPGSAARA